MNKWQVAKVGVDLAFEYECKAEDSSGKEVDGYYGAADSISICIYSMTGFSAKELQEKPPTGFDLGLPAGYSPSEGLEEREKWFNRQYQRFKDCGFCPELPDEPVAEVKPELPPAKEEEKTVQKPDLSPILNLFRNVAFKVPEPLDDKMAHEEPGASVDIKKLELIKIGRFLAADFEYEASKYDSKDDRNFWALEDAKAVKEQVNKLSESINSEELERQLKSLAPSSLNVPPRSAPLAEQIKWFFEECKMIEKCSFCGSLPDDLTVNTGLENRFPEAFYGLVKMGNDNVHDFPFRRCSQCGTYFQWFDLPEMYGTGNNDRERLVRLSKATSRLLDEIFSADPEAPANLYDIKKEIELIPIDILLQVLHLHVLKAPEIVAPFVPYLLNIVMHYDTASQENAWRIRDLLLTYVKYNEGKAEEVLEMFCSLKQYPMTDLIDLCLGMTGKKK